MAARLVRRLCGGASLPPEVAALAASLERHATIAEAISAHGGAAAYSSACPVVGASVGAHLRHSLEHAQCVAGAGAALAADGACAPLLAYDARARTPALEADPAAAAAASRACRADIEALGDAVLDAPVRAAFALAADGSGGDAAARSTLRREVAFAAHHATHHFAMAALIASGHLGADLDGDLGRAPATRRDDRARGR